MNTKHRKIQAHSYDVIVRAVASVRLELYMRLQASFVDE